MRPTTTTALALAGTALALPAGVALADTNDGPPSPTESVLPAPFAGHLTMNAQMRAERREAIVERREAIVERLEPKVIRTKHKTAKVKGLKFEHRAQKRRLRGDSPKELRTKLERSRRELRKAKRAAASAENGQAAAAGAAPGHLQAIAACESGGNYSTNTGNGFYGAYQFTQETWASVGGTGNPAAASPAEQDKRAAMLYAQQGSSPWPVCGQ